MSDSETTDLRGDDNKLAALVRIFKTESHAVTTARLALLAALIAVLLALSGHDKCSDANAKVDYQLLQNNATIESYEDTKAMDSVRYTNLLAYLRSKGIEIPPELEAE